MTTAEYSIGGRACRSYMNGDARFLLVQPVDDNDLGLLDSEVKMIAESSESGFCLVAFKIMDWNAELSPWEAPPVFGKVPFGSGASKTLDFILDSLVPDAVSRHGLAPDVKVVLGGYSLAGLFSLWAAYRSPAFSAVAAASPSVWFPGWMDIPRASDPLCKTIYLSLGDREEKTRNPVMSMVGNCIREQEKLLKESKQDIDCVLQWNEGNHFMNSDARCSKAFIWCLSRLS